MAGEDRPDEQQPSLELPSLSLRRRSRRRQRSEEPSSAATETAPVPGTPRVERRREPAGVRRPAPLVEQVVVADRTEPSADVPPPPPRRRVTAPLPTGPIAAALTGLVVGLGLVGLTWAFLGTCGALRGTTSCGAAGYPLVALVFVAMAVVATLLLRLARVSDPTSTGLLGLGLTGVVALLFLAGTLLSVWMVLVIPLLTAATFTLSHWLTTAAAGD